MDGLRKQRTTVTDGNRSENSIFPPAKAFHFLSSRSPDTAPTEQNSSNLLLYVMEMSCLDNELPNKPSSGSDDDSEDVPPALEVTAHDGCCQGG